METNMRQIVNVAEGLMRHDNVSTRDKVPPIVVPKRVFSEEGIEVPGRVTLVDSLSRVPVSVVSRKYTIVQHSDLVDAVDKAVNKLGLQNSPTSVYIDSGSWTFVCTNLCIGGGGVFAGGFVSAHRGEIPLGDLQTQLEKYLGGFGKIMELYRAWHEMETGHEKLKEETLKPFAERHVERIFNKLGTHHLKYNVLDAYNACTDYATHEMRSAALALRTMEQLNNAFQENYPVASVKVGEDGKTKEVYLG
jgi:hypothetical protein